MRFYSINLARMAEEYVLQQQKIWSQMKILHILAKAYSSSSKYNENFIF